MIQENKKVIKLVAVYGRVSSSNQENEGTIATQLSAVDKFILERGYVVVKKYLDEGWSGDILARPGLDQLRLDAKKRIFDAVVIYDPDRLARRGTWQEVVIEELKELEIDVLFVTIPPPKNDEDMIMFKMRGVFTEYERMKIKERFRIGKIRKASEGHVLASEAPYGYTFILKNGKRGDADFHQGYYEINGAEAQTVKKIFSWVVDDGLTLRGIVRKLQELGIPPRKSKRGVWDTSTLSTLLRNKSYIGESHYGASYAVVPINPIKKEGYRKIKKTSRRNNPESEWIKIPVPKLIDEDLFNRAGERLTTNFLLSARNTKNEYLLAGNIWCACGKRRAGEGPQKGKHLYYRCTDRVKSFPLPATCKEKGLNARIVDKMVWQKIAKFMSAPELLFKQAERWFGDKKKRAQWSVVSIEETKEEIAKLKVQQDRYAKAYGTGNITLEQFKDYTSPLKERTSVLNSQVAAMILESEQVNDKILPKLSEIEVFARKASEMLNDLRFEEKKAIVRSVINKVVGAGNELQVYGYIPITNINVFTSYRHCRFAERGEVHAF